MISTMFGVRHVYVRSAAKMLMVFVDLYGGFLLVYVFFDMWFGCEWLVVGGSRALLHESSDSWV